MTQCLFMVAGPYMYRLFAAHGLSTEANIAVWGACIYINHHAPFGLLFGSSNLLNVDLNESMNAPH